MKSNNRMQQGFTIIEIAIVLVVVTVLLGYTVAMFPIQQELKQYRKADSEMDRILEHLLAFAQVNGRLPCPDTSGFVIAPAGVVDGLEDRQGINDCKAFFGWLPARTLGMNGDYNAAGNLIDPWGQGYGYAVSGVNVNVSGTNVDFDLVTPNGIRDEGAFNVQADLFVCNDSATLGVDTDCSPAGANSTVVVGNVAVVIISLGKDFTFAGMSNIQTENVDDFHNGRIDKVYVAAGRSDANNAQYDDIVKWLSTNVLFSKMIEADQLP